MSFKETDILQTRNHFVKSGFSVVFFIISGIDNSRNMEVLFIPKFKESGKQSNKFHGKRDFHEIAKNHLPFTFIMILLRLIVIIKTMARQRLTIGIQRLLSSRTRSPIVHRHIKPLYDPFRYSSGMPPKPPTQYQTQANCFQTTTRPPKLPRGVSISAQDLVAR